MKVYLDSISASYVELSDDNLYQNVAEILANDKIVGWFQGRMEFGPRALGCRSILGAPQSRNMQSVMNLKIKYRESFRPFAPSINSERVSDYFELDVPSPYMLLVANVNQELHIPTNQEDSQLFGIDKLNVVRSSIPAVTHVDYSARIQTVHKETNPRYHRLISKYEKITSLPILVNTSFNVRGEPIVCTPSDAFQCFMRTEMDYMALGNLLLKKEDQSNFENDKNWQEEFELD